MKSHSIEHLIFKDLSHIWAICEHTNTSITMIPTGTEYSGLFRSVSQSCKVDKVKPKWWQCSFLHDNEYVAKENRWKDLDIIGTMEDIIDEWDGHIKFVTDHQDDSTYAVTKARIILHFLDGCKKTIWFENDTEMNNFLTNTINRENFNEILFIDGKAETTRIID